MARTLFIDIVLKTNSVALNAVRKAVSGVSKTLEGVQGVVGTTGTQFVNAGTGVTKTGAKFTQLKEQTKELRGEFSDMNLGLLGSLFLLQSVSGAINGLAAATAEGTALQSIFGAVVEETVGKALQDLIPHALRFLEFIQGLPEPVQKAIGFGVILAGVLAGIGVFLISLKLALSGLGLAVAAQGFTALAGKAFLVVAVLGLILLALNAIDPGFKTLKSVFQDVLSPTTTLTSKLVSLAGILAIIAFTVAGIVTLGPIGGAIGFGVGAAAAIGLKKAFPTEHAVTSVNELPLNSLAPVNQDLLNERSGFGNGQNINTQNLHITVNEPRVDSPERIDEMIGKMDEQLRAENRTSGSGFFGVG